MVINWYGEGCFKIQSGETVLMTDRLDESSGLSAPRFKFDVLMSTKMVFPIEYKNQPEDKIVLGPGEYEVKGIIINGWKVGSNKNELSTVYRVKFEDMTLGFLGGLKEMPSASIIEELGGVDILFVPAGGAPYIAQDLAVKLVKQLAPKMVIGTHFKIPGLKIGVSSPDEFLKEIGQKTELQEKLTIKKKDFTEKMQVVLLNP